MNLLCFFSRHKPVIAPLRAYVRLARAYEIPAPLAWECARCRMPLSDSWMPGEKPKDRR